MPRKHRCPNCTESYIDHPNIMCSAGCVPIKLLGSELDLDLQAFKTAARTIAETLHSAWGSDHYIRATGHGVSSSEIQAIVKDSIEELGFEPEKKNRVGMAGFKPDFTDAEGKVIIEVERGKTIDNNMDMLDMWKCHVHPTASHLILVVPVWYQTGKDTPVVKSCTYGKVCARLELFFEEQNLTNVRAAAIIGY